MPPTSRPERLLETAAVLALRDGKASTDEVVVLRRVARRLGLPEAATDAAVAAAQEGRATMALPRDKAERMALFHDLCEVAAADGHVDPQERSFLEQVATRLELPASLLIEGLAPMVAAAREAAASRRWRPKELLALAGLVGLTLLMAFFTGWFSSFEGVVQGREHRTIRSSGASSSRVYSLRLQGGERVDVPEAVHDAADAGATVTKHFGAVWWTVDGRRVFGPVTLAFALLVLSFFAGSALDTLLGDEDVATLCTFFMWGAAVAAGLALEITKLPGVAAGVLAVGLLPILWLVSKAWPRRASNHARRARRAKA